MVIRSESASGSIWITSSGGYVLIWWRWDGSGFACMGIGVTSIEGVFVRVLEWSVAGHIDVRICM